ncbi:MAG: MBL fold metallo-hydrolase [Oscillospiraceae bacterium]|nr:MBL fold metallo-hydrolase [Oscillospiraceae bacterium]
MEKPDLKEIFASFFAWKAKENTWFISFMGGTQFLYLLEGEEKALLVDTGYAVGGLREFVEKLTDKPIEVVNTHYHPDHAGGNGEWERVMMSAGAPLDFKSMARTVGDPNALPHPDYEKVYLEDGDTIDLGGRVVEVLRVEDAHSHSSLYLLDRTERLIIMGDEMDAWQVMMFENSNDPELKKNYTQDQLLRSFRRNLMRVKSLDSEYDWLLGNHNGSPLAKSYLDDFIELVDHIYIGDVTVEDKLNHKYVEMDPRNQDLCRIRWKKASIFARRPEIDLLLGSGK